MIEKRTLDESQKNLLYFITTVMSDKEGEEFTITKVHLCSQFYTFIPNHIEVGSMLIIANDAYFEGRKDYFEKNNITDYECIAQLNRSKNGKALFLKYKYNFINEKVHFKKNKWDGINETDYINIIQFPYLISAINRLYSNAKNGQITREVVEETLQKMYEEMKTDSPSYLTKRTMEKILIHSLNGKRK